MIKNILKHYPEITGIHPACEASPALSDDEYQRLSKDIRDNGLANDLLIDSDGMLVDGRHRLKACHEHAKEVRFKKIHGDPWKHVWTQNFAHRSPTTWGRALFGTRWTGHETAAAKERQGTRNDLNIVETFPQGNGTKKREPPARDKAGERVGVSGKSIDKARDIIKHRPDLIPLLENGDMAFEKAAKAAKETKNSKPSGGDPPKASTTKQMTRVITSKGKASEIPLPKKVVFNQTTDAVDWAKWTWNPLTGCEHGCKFCYARELANSERLKPYYPNGFEPTYHEYRLAAPLNTHKPDSDDPTAGRVFVCSMADLFGKWVPNGWIRSVFEACEGSPEWEYLFLTKWPARYSSMPLLPGAWYGASVIQQSDVLRVEKSMKKFDTPESVKWVSLEPMTSPIVFRDLSWCDLMVIGSQTSTTQPGDVHVPEIAPEFDWIVDVVNQCRDAGVPYYLKANLGMVRPGMKLPKPLPRGK
tara:strand:- start:376 stop:1794 length:1419 start_codon:yes stop_codon:yes gene_type:complete